jgi:hypothetical protein
MDYTIINVSPDPKKQGDYYTTLAGPYDEWAIEYGYTPFEEGKEEAGLKSILLRSTDPKLALAMMEMICAARAKGWILV